MVQSVCHQPRALSPRRVLVATGGTGGHLFPAIALAQDLLETLPGIQICFAGGGLVGSPFLDSSQGPWGVVPIEAPRWSLAEAWKIPTSLWTGVRESRQLLEDFEPELVIGFGSYHTLPVLAAAQRMGIPYLLHEGNAVPGRVNRIFASKAICTAVHFASARQKLKGEVAQVAMPLRKQFQQPIASASARAALGLDPEKNTLLVIGGSQGAQALNRLLEVSASQLAQTGDFQVIHLTGPKHQEEAFRLHQMYAQHGVSALVKPFEERMELAWRAADLCLARSGASSLAEQMACSVPGILVPFPAATDDHQTHNALSFAGQVGGAIVVSQKELTPHRLLEILKDLFEDQASRLQQMRATMLESHGSASLQSLSSLVAQVAGWTPQEAHTSL